MKDIELFDMYVADVMNMQMSVHAFGLAVKGIIEKQVEKIAELEFNAAEHKRLELELNKILHPNDDAPKNPSFCDLVSFVKCDLDEKNHQIENWRRQFMEA